MSFFGLRGTVLTWTSLQRYRLFYNPPNVV
nr:MAG TPA: hypothetical protein [Caudoviricetes sp.]